ncbi:YbhB/YbcL family Raf kinase inhibitor-like protein [Paraburkholderia sp. CNPSo 3272]|uniref:YbhB/YbcL family Raf kinase inhibitor-like protein n=1 Tax=Paraburkholderia sp. CNPSo 3272 TaxID=2940931 RepID=UPI0020B6FA95|nr:YbhB/YbcL family Raf kinase inhibitor-like protein [Paraburkholderia sp. CNPSo 3272]MCP3726609.1 YbhB/YbcL family Raf kinase inhibitor-like protein [Paraburkholderia sp. CNPSo 3272]
MASVAATTHLAYAGEKFTVSSIDFSDGGKIGPRQVFNDAGCNGPNQSPSLTWRNAPAATRSFAITIFDRDAPGRGWWHWAVANIPAGVTSLPENASAAGALRKLGAIEARNDFNIEGYGGPCPPPGNPHRYVVTVYALGVDTLPLAQGRPAALFDREISGSTLASAQITVTYGR